MLATIHTRIRRATAIAGLLVIAFAGTAFAGCPPVDLEHCTVLHRPSAECQQVKDSTQSQTMADGLQEPPPR